ncbi:MAG: HI0074 family nucleotidyltransferase substrate-binding subunit [Elusimicrobiota bacterium]|nr:HI0074 family nucleotidyltransferase substrate-binding subunit [Elusimicrobiota bacterium]
MAQDEKFKQTHERFKKAFDKYREIVKSSHLFNFLSEELIIEITTKRFEYTFESLWKTLKEKMRMEGVECSTPLKSFKEAFKAGLIDTSDEAVFIEMVEKRNQIVHIYDFEAAKLIYGFVKDEKVFSALERIFNRLSKAD